MQPAYADVGIASSRRRPPSRSRARDQIQRLLTAVRNDDRVELSEVVEEKLQEGSVLNVLTHLLDATRWELDELWYRGELGVVEEARLIRTVEEVIADALGGYHPPSARRQRCVVAGTHRVNATIATALFEEAGWLVTQYELPDLVDDLTARTRAPARVAVLAVESGARASDVAAAARPLRRLGCKVLLLPHGYWSPGVDWEAYAADALATNAGTALMLARRLYAT